MTPQFEVKLKMRRPPDDVFEAIVDPDRLGQYFVSRSTGRLEEGATVEWEFAEAPGAFPVHVREVIPARRIAFEWPAGPGEPDTRVVIRLEAMDRGATMVRISETGWRDTPEGIRASYENAGGWMHMMCSLKAHLEYGINLREGGAL